MDEEEIKIAHDLDVFKYDNVDIYDYICSLREQLSQLQQEKKQLKRHCKARKEFIVDKYQIEEENAFECCIEELDLIIEQLENKE